MLTPDYRGGSIVNLMASIIEGLGRRHPDQLPYETLSLLPPAALRQSPKVALLVLDGLGYDYLLQAGAGGALHQHLAGRITTVFPTTTAAAITTFLTGLAPKQHGLTGWFMWFKNLGLVAAPLPFRSRCGGFPLDTLDIDPADIFTGTSIFDRLDVASTMLQRRDLVPTFYTRAHQGRARARGYDGLGQLFDGLAEILTAPEPCFVYAYWPELDTIGHASGMGSDRARAHLREIDGGVARLLERIAGSGATLLVTADHGFVDTEPHTRLALADHPLLSSLLTLPLCGEQRVPYTYVQPGRGEELVDYVRAELADACDLLSGPELVAGEVLGLGDPSPRLATRVGDYVLAMKDNYVLRDQLLGEGPLRHIGVHGGASESELYVPLIVAQP